MRTFSLFLVGILLTIARGAALANADTAQPMPRTEIVYAIPEQYSGVTADDLARFKAWAEQRTAGLVLPGQKLVITISAIDLAGQREPWRGSQYTDVRIVREIYPPRIDLQFKLTDANGVVVNEGQRKLRSAELPETSLTPDDPQRFEKALFDDWLRREFSQS